MSGPTDAAVLESFDHRAPSPGQVFRIGVVRAACKTAARDILTVCPPSADRTAALRQLHEAMMTANKSIVLDAAIPKDGV